MFVVLFVAVTFEFPDAPVYPVEGDDVFTDQSEALVLHPAGKEVPVPKFSLKSTVGPTKKGVGA